MSKTKLPPGRCAVIVQRLSVALSNWKTTRAQGQRQRRRLATGKKKMSLQTIVLLRFVGSGRYMTKYFHTRPVTAAVAVLMLCCIYAEMSLTDALKKAQVVMLPKRGRYHIIYETSVEKFSRGSYRSLIRVRLVHVKIRQSETVVFNYTGGLLNNIYNTCGNFKVPFRSRLEYVFLWVSSKNLHFKHSATTVKVAALAAAKRTEQSSAVAEQSTRIRGGAMIDSLLSYSEFGLLLLSEIPLAKRWDGSLLQAMTQDGLLCHLRLVTSALVRPGSEIMVDVATARRTFSRRFRVLVGPGSLVVRLLHLPPMRTGFDSRQGRSRVFACRTIPLAGLLGDPSKSLHSLTHSCLKYCTPTFLRLHCAPSSSELKTTAVESSNYLAHSLASSLRGEFCRSREKPLETARFVAVEYSCAALLMAPAGSMLTNPVCAARYPSTSPPREQEFCFQICVSSIREGSGDLRVRGRSHYTAGCHGGPAERLVSCVRARRRLVARADSCRSLVCSGGGGETGGGRKDTRLIKFKKSLTTAPPGSIPGGVAPGFPHVGIVPDDPAGRRSFSGFFRFPPPQHSGAALPASSFGVVLLPSYLENFRLTQKTFGGGGGYEFDSAIYSLISMHLIIRATELRLVEVSALFSAYRLVPTAFCGCGEQGREEAESSSDRWRSDNRLTALRRCPRRARHDGQQPMKYKIARRKPDRFCRPSSNFGLEMISILRRVVRHDPQSVQHCKMKLHCKISLQRARFVAGPDANETPAVGTSASGGPPKEGLGEGLRQQGLRAPPTWRWKRDAECLKSAFYEAIKRVPIIPTYEKKTHFGRAELSKVLSLPRTAYKALVNRTRWHGVAVDVFPTDSHISTKENSAKAGREIEMKTAKLAVSKSRSEISSHRDESEIQNHSISLVQHFYNGTKIKLDPGSELGSFDLGSRKMLVQPGISVAYWFGSEGRSKLTPHRSETADESLHAFGEELLAPQAPWIPALGPTAADISDDTAVYKLLQKHAALQQAARAANTSLTGRTTRS
ncbi:hypothetical protein PR048_003753 [Dryococelus australis]|uniref:Uncharacterized protein n=1 Tax=Dryococelus australis TaxID=614101 RepID=A0ABQ9INZ7_9NEOP|nr:hypothetical protein PR048_003753 [Dryococelus australis]